MTLKVKVNYPHFQYQLRESQDAYLVQICWFELKSTTSHWMENLNFLKILCQNDQNDLEGQGQWPL